MKISFKNHHLFSSKSCNWMLIIALFGPLSSFGQINMMGQLKPISDGEKVVFVVEAWDTENWKQKDTIQLSADGKFNKTVKKMSGQCRLKIQPKPTQWLDFIIPTGPAGKSIDFGVIDRLRMNGLTAELKDPENIAYLKLNLAQRELQVAKDSFEQWILRAGVGTNPWHASYLAKHLALNTLCIQSAKDLKGTFTGDIVTRLYYSAASEAFEQNKYTDLTESAWQRQHALDHIPFDDPRILQHNRMMRLLIQYYKTYFYPDNNGTQHAMDQIMSYRKGNEMVDEWLFHFLWENSLIKKEDEPINYLISTYTSGCMEEIPGLDNSTNNRIIAFQNCVVGQPGADFKAMTITGDTTHLYGLEKPGKLNLLFFWRSDCSHCKEFEPLLAALYDRYHEQGLQIYAISLDQERQNWLDFLKANPTPWVNVTTTPDQRKFLNHHYPIIGTPSIIALDFKGTVLNRMLYKAGIENYIQETLQKIKNTNSK